VERWVFGGARFGFEDAPDAVQGTLEPGVDRPARDGQSHADLVRAQVHEVPEDEDGSVLQGQALEGAAQLVASDDRASRITADGDIARRQAVSGDPGRPAPGLVVAGVDEEPIGPRLELRCVSKAWDMPPDVKECLLCRILGEMAVSQDAVGDPEQARMVGFGERFERSLVTVLGSSHEVDVRVLWLRAGPLVPDREDDSRSAST
jgi:hypothetical protein